ncbi:MAG: ribosome silencing factor [Spongiibacteraceae bacterium]
MTADELKQIAIAALEDLKGREILALDVRTLTNVADCMVFCSGTSNRHVKSLADNVSVEVKKRGGAVFGIEGEDAGEWVLVDLGDVIVHVMLPETRAFYDLERMWSKPVSQNEKK